jgi:hypothetical protein
MNSTEPVKRGFRFRKRYAAAIAIVCLPLVCAIGVAGYFRLSSETQALRGSLMNLTPGAWDKKFAVHVGSLTMGLVRIGSRFLKLPGTASRPRRGARGGDRRLSIEAGAFVG